MKCFCTSAANDLSCAVTSLQSAHGAVSTTTHQYYTAQHTVLYNTVHRDYTRQDEIQIETAKGKNPFVRRATDISPNTKLKTKFKQQKTKNTKSTSS